MTNVVKLKTNNYECDLELLDEDIMPMVCAAWVDMKQGNHAPLAALMAILVRFVLERNALDCLGDMATISDIAMSYGKEMESNTVTNDVDKVTNNVVQFPNNQSTKVH